MSAPDPRAELAALTAGLRAHVERLRGRGRLRAPLGAAAEARVASVEAATGPTAAVAAPTPAPTPAPAPAPVRAPAPPVGAGEQPEPASTTKNPRLAQPLSAGSPDSAAASRTHAAPPPTAEVARAAADLEALERAVAGCEACGLCSTRTRTVFADGRPSARVMFVGEAPGADEDRQGVPFVGRAGQLLTDIITKGMGLRRPDDVYIANLLKCRPPENRDPSPEEKRLCTPFLERQIELVDPQVIVPLGRHAAQYVLSTDAPMGRLRGRVHRLGKRAVVPTYHPAYLLRSPNMKPAAWEDIQLAMAELGLPIPARARSRRPEQG